MGVAAVDRDPDEMYGCGRFRRIGQIILRIKANTESLGRGTTTSVVTAITVVILADAVYAIIFSNTGF